MARNLLDEYMNQPKRQGNKNLLDAYVQMNTPKLDTTAYTNMLNNLLKSDAIIGNGYQSRARMDNTYAQVQGLRQIAEKYGIGGGSHLEYLDSISRGVADKRDFLNQFSGRQDYNERYAYPQTVKGKTDAEIEAMMAGTGDAAYLAWLNNNTLPGIDKQIDTIMGRKQANLDAQEKVNSRVYTAQTTPETNAAKVAVDYWSNLKPTDNMIRADRADQVKYNTQQRLYDVYVKAMTGAAMTDDEQRVFDAYVANSPAWQEKQTQLDGNISAQEAQQKRMADSKYLRQVYNGQLDTAYADYVGILRDNNSPLIAALNKAGAELEAANAALDNFDTRHDEYMAGLPEVENTADMSKVWADIDYADSNKTEYNRLVSDRDQKKKAFDDAVTAIENAYTGYIDNAMAGAERSAADGFDAANILDMLQNQQQDIEEAQYAAAMPSTPQAVGQTRVDAFEQERLASLERAKRKEDLAKLVAAKEWEENLFSDRSALEAEALDLEYEEVMLNVKREEVVAGSKYNELAAAPDFEALSAYDSSIEDDLYKYLNTKGTSQETGKKLMLGMENYGYDADEIRDSVYSDYGYTFLLPEEVQAYNYIYKNEDREKAQEFLDSFQNIRNLRARSKESEEWAKYAEETGAWSSVVSWGTKFASGMMYPVQLADAVFNPDHSQFSSLYSTNYATQAIRGVRGEVWDKKAKEWFGGKDDEYPKFMGENLGSAAYNLFMGLGDMTLAHGAGKLAATLGNINFAKGVTEYVVGSQVGSDVLLQNLHNGVPKDRAIAMAVAASVVESLTERFSIDAIWKDPDNAAKFIAKNIATEASEESASSFANTIVDLIVNANHAELSKAIAKDGYEKAMNAYLQSVGLDAIMGGLTGAIMSGAKVAGSAALNTAHNVSNTINTGKQINTNQTYKMIHDLAVGMPETSKARKLAEKKGEKVGAGYAGRVYRALMEELDAKSQDTIRNTMTTEVKNRLRELGTTDNLDEAAAAIQKLWMGGKLSAREQNIIAQTPNALQVQKEVLEWDDGWVADVRERNAGEQLDSIKKRLEVQQLASKGYRAENEQVSKALAENASTTFDNASEEKGLNSKAYTEDGTTVEIKRIEEQDGKPVFVVDQGGQEMAYAIGDLHLDSYNTSALVNPLRNAQMSAAAANILYHSYATSGLGAADFARAFQIAYNAGTESLGMPYVDSNTYTRVLSPETRKAAYDAGRKDAKPGRKAPAKKTGNVTFTRGVDQGSLTDNQWAAIEAAKRIAPLLGVDIVFFESKANAEGKYTQANGAFHDNTLYLDVHAGRNNAKDVTEFAILRTMSHELTHYIAANDKQAYRELQDFVVTHLTEKGKSISDLVDEKKARESRKMSDAAALEEVVADACEMMLKNTTAIETLARENATLFEKIADWIRGFLDKLRKAFEGVEATHAEALALEGLEELQELWDKALVSAARNVQGAQENAADSDGGMEKFSLRQIDRMTEKQYNTYGWVAVNDVLTRQEQAIFLSIIDTYGVKGKEKTADGNYLVNIWTSGRDVYIVTDGKKKNPSFERIYVFGGDRYSLETERIKEGVTSGEITGSIFSSEDYADYEREGLVRRYDRQNQLSYSEAKARYRNNQRPAGRMVQRKSGGAGASQSSANRGGSDPTDGRDGLVKRQARDADTISSREILANTRAEDYKQTTAQGFLVDYQKAYQELVKLNEKLVKYQKAATGDLTPEEKYRADNRVQLAREQVIKQENKLSKLESNPEFAQVLTTERLKLQAYVGSKSAEQIANTIRKYEAKIEALGAIEKDTKEKAKKARQLARSLYKQRNRWIKEGDALNLARKLVQENSSTLKATELAPRLRGIFERMANETGEGYVQAANELNRIAGEIVSNAQAYAESGVSYVGDYLKGKAIRLTDTQKQEVRSAYGTLAEFRRQTKLNITDKGTDLTQLWGELNGMNPALFDAQATEGDMVYALASAMEAAQPEVYNPFAGSEREAAAEIAADLLDEGTALTVHLPAIEAQKKHYQSVIATLKSESAQKLAAANARGRERLEKYREKTKDTLTRSALRDRIRHDVKTLNRLLLNETDTKHVPEELKGAVAQFLTVFTQDSSVFGNRKTGEGVDENGAVFTKTILDDLRAAYGKISDRASDENRDMPQLASLYDGDIAIMLDELRDTIGNRRLSELDQLETESVYNIVKHFKHLIQKANNVFVEGRNQQISALGDEIIKAADEQKQYAGKDDPVRTMLTKGMITPSYFFKKMGGSMKKLFDDLKAGESMWGLREAEARKFFNETAKKYNYWDWAEKREGLKPELLKIETSEGKTITLTREQAMSLYATWNRETSDNGQSARHLAEGGFVYEDAMEQDKISKKVTSINTKNPFKITKDDMAKVEAWLTDEQKGYVREMVRYMSEDMAKLGNEVSMQLFGYEKYTEKNYFPYQSSKNWLYTAPGQRTATNDQRLKHASHTHKLTNFANNPIILSDFTTVWSGHVNHMILYSSMCVPLENLNRVYNYKYSELVPAFNEKGEPEIDKNTGEQKMVARGTQHSVKNSLENAYGRKALEYIDQLMVDMNGGVRVKDDGIMNRLSSVFKKNAVMLSASVVVQQPSAMVRAMALVDPKYFAKGVAMHSSWNELKQYSGLAVIKEMGGFDTGVGESTQNWLVHREINRNSNLDAIGKELVKKDSVLRSEVMGFLPAKADELTWTHIWRAVKAETRDRTDLAVNSEAFLREAARRFDEVISYTQVYDSTLSKSQMMRNKSLNMVTAFMAEPTVTYNLLVDAFTNRGKADSVNPARAVAAFVATTLVNAMLKSIVYAARDDDEEKGFWDKYFREFTESAVLDLTFVNSIPYARDIISLIQGYDVERPDMSVISDVVDNIKNIFDDDLTGEQRAKEIAILAGNITGVPVKNVIRDVNAMLNVWNMRGTLDEAPEYTGRTFLESLTFWSRESASTYYGYIVDEMEKGNTSGANELWEYTAAVYGKTDKAIKSGAKTQLGKRYKAGKIGDAEATDILMDYFEMDADEAYWQLKEWREKEAHKDEDDYSFSRTDDLKEALLSGKTAQIEEAKTELAGVGGYTDKEVTSKAKSAIKSLYVDGQITIEKAMKLLQDQAGEMTKDDLYWLEKEWAYDKAHPDGEWNKYMKVHEAIEAGKGAKEAAKELLAHGVEKGDAAKVIANKWKETYVTLYQTDRKAALDLHARILDMYVALGYSRSYQVKYIKDHWFE